MLILIHIIIKWLVEQRVLYYEVVTTIPYNEEDCIGRTVRVNPRIVLHNKSPSNSTLTRSRILK